MSQAELAQSFLDLWHHFDGVEAGRYDREGPPPVLAAFDKDTTREHGAAFRSLAAAVEDLEIEQVDEEIDRTILVDLIRVRIRRVEKERPERWNPLLWSNRLRTVLASRAADADTVALIPDWVEKALGTITAPPVIHLELAREDIRFAKAALAEHSAGVEVDLLVAAGQALDRFEYVLGHDLEPDPDPAAGALGDDAVLWRLHHDARLEMTPAEGLRRLGRRQAELAARLETPVPAAEIVAIPDAVDLARRHPSMVRRRLIGPDAVRGWQLFAREALEGGDVARRTAALGESFVATLLGTLDLGIQTGQTPAARGIADTAARLPGRVEELRDLLLHPLESMAAAAYAILWLELYRQTGDGPMEFAERVGRSGLLHPVLAAWSFGADGA